LFTKFKQVGNHKSKTQGTGLGLYVSRELAVKMHGDLAIQESKVDQGSTFVLTLPLSESE
jgi:signal transduction histidine kinase